MQKTGGNAGVALAARRARRIFALLALALFAGAVTSAQPQPERVAAPVFRWQPALFRWQYNPAHAPTWLAADEAQAMVERAVNGWRACAVEIRFEGLTDRVPGVMDGTNVLGWAPNLAVAQRGVTTGRTRRDGVIIERDVVVGPEREEFRRFPRLMQKVLAHEAGHALGLAHAQGCDEVMSSGGNCPMALPVEAPVVPTPGDLAACAERYGVKSGSWLP